MQMKSESEDEAAASLHSETSESADLLLLLLLSLLLLLLLLLPPHSHQPIHRTSSLPTASQSLAMQEAASILAVRKNEEMTCA